MIHYLSLILSFIASFAAGWYAKATYDYSKTPQEDLAQGYELKFYRYGPMAIFWSVISIATLIYGLPLH